MGEFERIFDKYTIISIAVIVVFSVCAVAITVYVKGQGNFFTIA